MTDKELLDKVKLEIIDCLDKYKLNPNIAIFILHDIQCLIQQQIESIFSED